MANEDTFPTDTDDTQVPTVLSDKQINDIVEEHIGWATAIAKSVARSWNLDWQMDGLDGGAFEGLLFCARRYDPSRGVPFKSYARRRIHEGATEQARKSKSWQRGVGCDSEEERQAREISVTLFDLFPEMREGILPKNFEGDIDDTRGSVRQLVTGASLLIAFQESGSQNQESMFEYKNIISVIMELEKIHQTILYELYWQGKSMRGLAKEWEIDELAIVREHKEILAYLSESVDDKKRKKTGIKVRRALRTVSQKIRKANQTSPFEKIFMIALFISFISYVFELHSIL